jgi:hypothetical protein
MTSARPKVSSTDIDGDRPRSRTTTSRYSVHPRPNISGVVTTDAAIGSSPVVRHSHQVSIATRTRNAPWATLMMSITPKIRVRPEAIRA